LSLLGKNGLSLSRLIDAMSTRPAKLVGIDPPTLCEGHPAELCLFDAKARWTPAESELRSKSRNTPFLKREITGRVALTLAGGGIAFDGAAR
jgi:dihydroorotase